MVFHRERYLGEVSVCVCQDEGYGYFWVARTDFFVDPLEAGVDASRGRRFEMSGRRVHGRSEKTTKSKVGM